MKAIELRLTALEQHRPDGVQTVKHMSDAELVRFITGGQATDITDDQLERIVKGETWEASRND